MSDVESLLRLSNGAALHKALREQGAGVSYRTVARWIGATPSAKPPAELIPALEAVFGITKEPPPEVGGGFVERWLSDEPPPWATGLAQMLIAEIRVLRDETAARTVREVFDRIVAGEPLIPTLGESAPGTQDRPEPTPAGKARRKK